MTKKNDEDVVNKKPISSLSSDSEEKPEEVKATTEVPPVKNVLREPEREKSKLTEILLILIIILLGTTSVYFYQANERLTEKYNNLSENLIDNSGSLSLLKKDLYLLKSEKDNSKGLLVQIQQDISGLLTINETMKDRIYNLSEGQRENIREIHRIVSKISTTEKDEAINELKKALLIVNGINRKGTGTEVHVFGEKLESDISQFIQQIANDGKPSVAIKKTVITPEVKQNKKPETKALEKITTKKEVKKTGFGRIELQEVMETKEGTTTPLPKSENQEEPSSTEQ